MAILKDIYLGSRPYSIINTDHNDKMCNLSKVNIFVGANNTGKSRFLRSLFYIDKNNKLKFLPSDELLDYYTNKSYEFKKDWQERRRNVFNSYEQQVNNKVYEKITNIDTITEAECPLLDLVNLFDENKNRNRNSGVNKLFSKIHETFFEKITFDENLFKYNFYKIYIPSLRGLIPINYPGNLTDDEHADFFAERTKNDCFMENSRITTNIANLMNEPHEPKNAIITGQKFYDYVKNYLLGDLKQRNIISRYEQYLSETFFNGEKTVLIPKVNDDVLTVKIGNEMERPIFSLGEGIQSIILITLPLFLYLDKSKEINTSILVFIEEPEVGLHPELQRKLLKTFLNPLFDNYQFFFTTHSNHFMDRTFEEKDISVYSFDKHLNDEENSSAKFTIENVGFDHIPTLKRLGALPSSVLLDNCTIMVEESTDKKHYEHYFKLYQEHLEHKKPNFKKYSKKVHYSFSIGGGSEAIESIKEFTPIEKERIFFILDNDSDEDTLKKKEQFADLEYNNYYFLNVKEVENLIPLNSVVKTMQKVYNISEREMNLDFDVEEYYSSDNFYDFIIKKIFNNSKPKNFPNKKNKSKLKDHLAKKEPQFIENYEDLTQEAKNVAIEIYKFIKKNNP